MRIFQTQAKWLSRLAGLGLLAVVIVVVIVAALAGYRLARWQLAAEVYRERLTVLQQDYERLRSTYNDAVRRTAVTELLVEDSQLSVRIRTAEGVQRTIPTPFDPRHEIYVDYVVVDGRLWIRRVFDAFTAPERGVVIDPKLAEIDWDSPSVEHGKAAYRQLGEGRWVVTVTGDGSLGLAKQVDDAVPELSAPPEVREHSPVEQELASQRDGIGPLDVLWKLVGG